MKKYIKAYIITTGMFILILSGVILSYEYKVSSLQMANKKYSDALEVIEKEKATEINTYKYLYEENKKDLAKAKQNYESLNSEYTSFKNNIAYTKSHVAYSRGASSDLTKFKPITTEELNEWIQERAPKNSPFIGNARAFIRASHESGLDPKYIVAHAAIESGWGTSNIARNKNNFFGIGAYNSSPYKSAYKFKSIDDGIIAGAKWISDNYINKGQNTLEKMIFGQKAYCVTNRGLPDPKWITKINSIMIK